jgi:hypothetical protein
VKNDLHSGKDLPHPLSGTNVLLNEFNAIPEWLQVRHSPGGQVIHDQHFVPSLHQGFHQV